MIKKKKQFRKRIVKVVRKIDWKSCIIGIILSLIVVLSFNLFIVPELNKSWDRRLQDAVDACPYSTTEYKEGVFDCSNMANMLDDWLEGKYNYLSMIIIFHGTEGGDGHAMVTVNGVFIEPTTKKVGDMATLLNTNPNAFGIILIDDVERLLWYYGEEAWIKEWSYPKRW